MHVGTLLVPEGARGRTYMDRVEGSGTAGCDLCAHCHVTAWNARESEIYNQDTVKVNLLSRKVRLIYLPLLLT